MKEVGIDVSQNVPTKLSKELIEGNGVTIVVTMGWWVQGRGALRTDLGLWVHGIKTPPPPSG
jgi:hypothetical protein